MYTIGPINYQVWYTWYSAQSRPDPLAPLQRLRFLLFAFPSPLLFSHSLARFYLLFFLPVLFIRDSSLHCFINCLLTLLELQSHYGDKPLKFQVVCPQNGTPVLKGLNFRAESGTSYFFAAWAVTFRPFLKTFVGHDVTRGGVVECVGPNTTNATRAGCRQ